jgi:ribosome maturation factor RimP
MKGKVVGIWPKAPLDGKTYFEGIISDVSAQSVTIDAKGKNHIIDFDKINLGKEKLEG